jgi:hypothetical protein
VELMWLTGRLAPDFKTIANARPAKSAACAAGNTRKGWSACRAARSKAAQMTVRRGTRG